MLDKNNHLNRIIIRYENRQVPSLDIFSYLIHRFPRALGWRWVQITQGYSSDHLPFLRTRIKLVGQLFSLFFD
jgi:hypothetical protein